MNNDNRRNESKRVLVYSDTAIYGGHDVTLIEAIAGIINKGDIRISVFFFAGNKRFNRELKRFRDKIDLFPMDVKTMPGDIFRALLKLPKVRRLAVAFKRLKPDIVLVSQGAIGHSVCGLAAAKFAGLKTVSYLPMAHPVSLVRNSRKLSILCQEVLYKYLYKLPDFYITTSTVSKNILIKEHGLCEDRILVNYFGLDLPALGSHKIPDKQGEEKIKRVGVIGRVEFDQKRQDFLVHQIAKHKGALNGIIFHVIGDGPDLLSLKNLIKKYKLESVVKCEGWAEDVSSWFSRLDILLLPSRFEGVPLVMLEAMYWELPVVASNRDGMKEFLPDEWLFSVDDGSDMIRRINYVINYNQKKFLSVNKKKIIREMNVEVFRSKFYEMITCLCSKNPCLFSS